MSGKITSMVVRLQQLFVASLGLPSSSLCNGQTVSATGAFPAHGLHFGLEYDVSESLHPSAPHDLPVFITAPGDTDVLIVVVGAVLILAALAVGNPSPATSSTHAFNIVMPGRRYQIVQPGSCLLPPRRAGEITHRRGAAPSLGRGLE